MANSGRFNKLKIPQIQGVAYLNKAKSAGGEFLFYHSFQSYFTPSAWINFIPQSIQWLFTPLDSLYRLALYSASFLAYPPIQNSAIVLDGSIIPHGTALFQPEVINTQQDLPWKRMGKTDGVKIRIVYQQNQEEQEKINNKEEEERPMIVELINRHNEVLRVYSFDSVRISLVWRSMCFKDEQERDHYHQQSQNNPLSLQEILDELFTDLIERGRWNKESTRPTGFHLAQFLLQEYSIKNIAYPMAPTWLPWNYCALERVEGLEWIGRWIKHLAC
jgi:hypothetical protein